MKLKTLVLIAGIFLLIICIDIAVLLFFSKTPYSIQRAQGDAISLQMESKRFLDACGNESNKTRCYQDLFTSFTRNHSLTDATKLLEVLTQLDKDVSYCHPYAHRIAHAEVEKNPKDWLGILGVVDPFACTRGFFHGVIEAHIGTDSDFTLSKESITQMCTIVNQVSSKKTYDDTSCVHAIGHVLLVQERGNMSTAITVCSKLQGNNVYGCAEGVFMENTNRANLSEHGIAERRSWDTDFIAEQEDLCLKYSGKVASACFVTLADMYASVYEGNQERLYSLCQQAPATTDKKQCYLQAAGFSNFLSISRGKNNKNIFEFCEATEGEKDYNRCVTFLVGYLQRSLPNVTSLLTINCQLLSDTPRKVCLTELEKR